jgi:hypothetical protein
VSSDSDLSWPRRVVGRFLDRFGLGAEPRSNRRLTKIPYSLHLTTATGIIDLFPAGPLDVLTFYQRHHCSLGHEVEYVACRPTPEALLPPSRLPPGPGGPDDLLAYAVFKLDENEETPWSDLNVIEDRLQRDYGSFFQLPRARPLLEHQYGEDLNDEDPPEGHNRVVVPSDSSAPKGSLSTRAALSIMCGELSGPELISWLEAAFRQRPPEGEVEHRYYVDATAQLYLVRDHFREGKTLYHAETAPEALGPLRPR